MPVINESIEIELPPERLWEIAALPETVRLTNGNLVEYERTNRGQEGTIQQGDEFRGVTRVAGRAVEWTSRCTTADQGKLVEMESIEAPMSFRLRIEYQDLGDGRTRYEFHQEVGEFGGFFGKVADNVVTRMYSKQVRGNLEALKEYAEAQ